MYKVNEADNKFVILIVDDEKSILSSLRRLLLDENYLIKTAEDAGDALSILKTIKIQLVISDYKMPTMSGDEFLRIVKDKYPECKRMMLTGASDTEHISDAIAEGILNCQWFVTKPWDDDILKDKIREALESKVNA